MFLRTGTVAATRNFNMNNEKLQDVAAIRPHDTNINIGNSTSLSGVGQIVLGDFTRSSGSSNVCIGLQNIARNLGVAIGKETMCGVGGVSVGYRSQTSQTDVIQIGRDNFQIHWVLIFLVLTRLKVKLIHYCSEMDHIVT